MQDHLTQVFKTVVAFLDVSGLVSSWPFDQNVQEQSPTENDMFNQKKDLGQGFFMRLQLIKTFEGNKFASCHPLGSISDRVNGLKGDGGASGHNVGAMDTDDVYAFGVGLEGGDEADDDFEFLDGVLKDEVIPLLLGLDFRRGL